MATVPDPLARALADRYTVEREVGAGGMATVYLARDLKHDRQVAIKVLRPELAAVLGADRFVQEIKTTAHLQHPHILPLFDSGEAAGFLYYVMPYVEGESLRDRLNREKQLGIEEAVRITCEVADALDYAHRHDVIHRDIKPANILLHDGRPLVADFGIALAISEAGGTRITETGLSLGTPHYMSPEQASADPELDGRTDTYSLGAMAYEMLVGRPPFTSASAQGVMSKTMTEPAPRVSAERPSVPPNVDAAVSVALAKLPADRFSSPARFAAALSDAAFVVPGHREPAAAPGTRNGIAWVTAAVLGLAALWGWLRPTAPVPGDRPLSLSFELPDGQVLAWAGGPTLAISPEGDRIVYVGSEGGTRRLYVRDMDDFDIRSLDGTDGGYSPVVSPDGQSVAYWAEGALWRVPITGGIPTRITTHRDIGRGLSWGEDDTIVFAGTGWTLWRVPADGGSEPQRIDLTLADDSQGPTPPETGDAMWPDLLPGNRALVVIAFPIVAGIVDLATGEFASLVSGANRLYYLAPDEIVYYAGGETVSRASIDLDRKRIGKSEPIVDDAVRPAGSENRFVVSRRGVLAYATGGFERRIALFDRTGRAEELALQPRGYRFPSVSPDGKWIAITVDPQPPEIWMIELERAVAQPIATGGYDLAARWAPDGSRISFHRLGESPNGLYWTAWPGFGEYTLVGERFGGNVTWLDTNRIVATVRQGDLVHHDLERQTTTDLIATPAREVNPAASPDGRWIAYDSDASGTREVYVIAHDGRSAPTPISSGGGVEPRWSRDGTAIFYRRGSDIWEARVRVTSGFAVVGNAQRLFSAAIDPTNGNNWDVLPDGRFVVVQSGPKVGREVRVMLNWR